MKTRITSMFTPLLLTSIFIAFITVALAQSPQHAPQSSSSGAQHPLGKKSHKGEFQSPENTLNRNSPINFVVHVGDKHTNFQISKTRLGGQIESQARGTRKVRELSAQNYDFLHKRLSQAAGPSEPISTCNRMYFEVTQGPQKTIICMSETKRSKELINTASVINLLF